MFVLSRKTKALAISGGFELEHDLWPCRRYIKKETCKLCYLSEFGLSGGERASAVMKQVRETQMESALASIIQQVLNIGRPVTVWCVEACDH